MTEAEVLQASWFTPWHFLIYLSLILCLLVGWLQFKWSHTCNNYIQVLVAESGGGGSFKLAPKSGGTVNIENPHTGTVRMWAINELATIEVPYPGIGFIPSFLQKTIRMAIVSEGDWEPMLNRSRHYVSVASPDVVEVLNDIETATNDESTSKQLKSLVENISTSPTREMIASPAFLGNLMQEKITEAIMTVNKEVMESINNLIKRLRGIVTPLMFFIGVGALGVILIYLTMNVMQIMPVIEDMKAIGTGEIIDKLNSIQDTLGIVR